MNTYNKRTWLDEASHSTSHIVCYFDKDCLNNSLALFVKISDCTDSWNLIDNGSSKYTNSPEKSIQFLNILIDTFNTVLSTILIKEQVTNKVFNIQKNKTKLILNKADNLISLKILTRTGEFVNIVTRRKYISKTGESVNVNTRRKFKWKTRVCLHSDKETCNEEVFISKLSKIINDLESFKTFIVNI